MAYESTLLAAAPLLHRRRTGELEGGSKVGPPFTPIQRKQLLCADVKHASGGAPFGDSSSEELFGALLKVRVPPLINDTVIGQVMVPRMYLFPVFRTISGGPAACNFGAQERVELRFDCDVGAGQSDTVR